MTKITKRIWLAICSCLFAVCLAFTGWIFADSNKTVKADATGATVAFDSIDATQNNTSWNNNHNGWQAVYINFTGAEFTGDNLSALPDGVTCTPAGQTVTQYAVWKSGNQIQFLYNTGGNDGVFIDGATLTIAEGTVIFGQTFPALNFVVKNGKWVLEGEAGPLTFTGIGALNNVNHPKFSAFPTVNVEFNKDFTAGTVDCAANTSYNDKIYYTTPTGTGAFRYIGIGTGWDAPANELQLMLESAVDFPVGSTITIKEGTEIGGQVLPEVTLYMHDDGVWHTTKQPLTFTGIGVLNNVVHPQFNAFQTVNVSFSGDFVAASVDCAGDASYNDKIYYITPSGKVAFGFIGIGTTWSNSATNVLQLMATNGATIPDGSVLTIVAGTEIGGQVLPEVTLYMDGGKWQTEEPAFAFTGIGALNNENHPNFNAFPTVNVAFNKNFTEGTVDCAANTSYNDKIYYTTPTGTGAFRYIGIGTGWSAPANELQLMLESAVDFPVGSTITIKEGTEIGGRVLPEVTLYYNTETKLWQTTAIVIEPTVSFVGFGPKNYDDWNGGGTFYATYLEFSGTFAEGQYTSSGIYYTDKNGENEQSFKFIWAYDKDTANGANGPLQEDTMINLMVEGNIIPGGSILRIEKNTEIGGQRLPEVTLYMNYEGKWQDTVPEEPVVTFTGIGAHNNDNWLATGQTNPDPGYVALDLVFSGDFKVDANGTPGSYSAAIYYTLPGDATHYFFDFVWANNETADANVIQLLMGKGENVSPKEFYPDSAVLHIEEGTVVGGKILPALTLYLNLDGEWQEDKCLQKYVGFTTVEGGSIRVSSDGHNGLRFESRIDYGKYNALVASGENQNAVELGTYILPKHYLEAYIALKGGNLYTYLTTQTEGTHYYKISTWDSAKNQNGFVNRKTAEADGYYKYYGSITDILLDNYTTEFIGVGYMIINGDLYLTHDGSWSRSVYYVAEQAYTDKNDDGSWKMSSERQKEALLQYLGNVVSIYNEGDKLVDNWDKLNEVRPVDGVEKGYTLELNATTGIITIVAGENGLGGVVIDGSKLGSIAAGTTRYANYYSVNRELVDTEEAAGAFHFGIVEPTQELWGDLEVDGFNKTFGTGNLNEGSTATNIAKVNKEYNGDTARIWFQIADVCWPNSLEEFAFLDGSINTIQGVVNDSRAQGVTNIALMSGVANYRTTTNYYKDGVWYSFWNITNKTDAEGNAIENAEKAVPYPNLIVLPNEGDYQDFLALQKEYFKQLALNVNGITTIEILNELETSILNQTRFGIQNGYAPDIKLVAQAAMDICKAATDGVKEAGKNIKIMMPALCCVDEIKDGENVTRYESVALLKAEYAYIMGENGTKNADDYFQIINIHPYVSLSEDTSSTNYLYPSGSGTAQSYTDIKTRWTNYVNGLREIAVDNGDAEKPFWITEFGIADYEQCSAVDGVLGSNKWSDYKDNTVARQARVFQAVFDAIEEMPWIDTVMVFRMGDYGHDNTGVNQDGLWYATCGEASYGMITADGTLKDIGKYLYAIVNGQEIWSGEVGNSNLISTSNITGIGDVTSNVEKIY